MDGAAGLAMADQAEARILMEGPVGAAFIEVLGIAGLGQHGARHAQVIRLAIMGGAAQGDLFRREAETVRRATLDYRQALEGLDGGARIDRGGDGALGRDHVARRIDHRIGAAVAALDDAAAGDFGDHGIGHARSLCGAAARYQT